jgi:serine/threonine-protein kinase
MLHAGNLEQRLDAASRSAVWPLSLALIVGVALGFAGGYWLGQSGRREPAGVTASANVATAGTETEVSIKPDPIPQRPADVPPMSAAPPAAVPSAVEPSTAPRTPPPAEAAKPKPEPAAVARTGRITVRTTPAGARVLVDGKDVGKTPLTVPNLARGAHTVRVMRDGYTSLDRRVSITAGEPTATLSLNLTRTPPPAARAASPAPAAPANAARAQTSLLVESRPTGATVFLDGKRVGTTPMSLPSVTAGNHAVRLEMMGFKPWTASVRVVSGERNRVAASLEQ